MRKIAVVTVGRSDYGIYRPVLERISAEPTLELQLIVAGAHWDAQFGDSAGEIGRDGFPIAERLLIEQSGDESAHIAAAMGAATSGFGAAYARLNPDIVLLLGDRFEMHAAAVAAVPFGLPIAHIHGGELTLGAIDDALRHSMTKLSHLHFAATEDYARRIVQMGEEPWRVTVSGAPGLDNLARLQPVSMEAFASRHGLVFSEAPLLVTFHPVTLERGQSGAQMEELLAALADCGRPVLFTLPNADAGHRGIIERIAGYTAANSNAFAVANLGTRDYFSAMGFAAAMVGNSSSGIIEAASFELPVVNVGTRQDGRLRAANVVDADCTREEIREALARVLAPGFRRSLGGLVNPFGTGTAAASIVRRLSEVALGSKLIVKRFHDMR